MNIVDSNLLLNKEFVPIKPAAIWARVSTTNQADTSLPSQVSRCKEKLEQAGYSVIHVLQADWTSMDLYSCPQFQELQKLIKNREIAALGIFDRDRLQAEGILRLVFLSELKDAGIELIICQGPPIMDQEEGQLIELALAIGKKRSVLRARQGSKDGLHDRAVKYNKPVTFHKLFGYNWDKENLKLVPNDDWSTVKLIFDMFLQGSGYQPVITELKKRIIASPSGQSEWNKTALSNIAHNPAYAGRYYSLKSTSIEPNKRNGNTYGNSSVKRLQFEDWHHIPEIIIENPPITWEQREYILDQLVKHQKLAQRNAKRNYLLRGMIFCETHRGKNGEPRRYHGQPHHGSWRYTCPVGKDCSRPYLNGPEIEQDAKGYVSILMFSQSDEFYENLFKTDKQEISIIQLNKELKNLDKKYDQSINAEAKLEDRFINGLVELEVYQRLKAQYQVERGWIKDRKVAINDQKIQISRRSEIINSFQGLRRKYINKFARGLERLPEDKWREIFYDLNLECHIRTMDDSEDWDNFRGPYNFDKKQTELDRKRGKLGFYDYWFQIGVPVNLEEEQALSNIAKASPAPG